MKKAIVLMAIVTMASIMAKDVNVQVALSPAGSFEIKSEKIKGTVSKSGDKLSTKGLYVKVRHLSTGLDLRDEHMHKKLGKNSKIEVLSAVGKGGKGQAEMKINGVKKKVPFSYSESGSSVNVNFDLSLAAFGIKGINYAGVGVKDKIKIKANVPLK